MRGIAAVMVTVDRTPKPNYLAETLENLKRGGCRDSKHLLRIDLVSPDLEWASRALPGQNCMGRNPANLNVASALRFGADTGAPWTLFLEDDIDVCANFFDSAGAWLDDHARDDRRAYFFGANFGEVGDLAAKGIHAWDYPIDLAYGTQAFAVRSEDAASLADYLEEHCYDLTPEGTRYDHLMRGWAKERWPEIDHFLASCPSFVQHTGRSSVIDPREVVHVFPSWPGREWSYVDREGGAKAEPPPVIRPTATEPTGVRTLAVLTPFRNARKHLPRYFRQLTALRQALAPSIRLRLVAAEGDSVDGTRQAILDRAHEAGISVDLVPTDHGGMHWKSVEDPARMRTMSNVMNAALSAVEPTDDLVLWIMSDLGWDASTIRDLVLAAESRRDGFDVLAPLVFQGENFYDTWAYRSGGTRFRATPPHHENLVPGQLSEVDSAGTCLAMRAGVARAARATDQEAVSWCADARRHGARIAVSDRWKVEHDPPQARRLLWLGDAVAPTGFSRCTHGVVPALMEAGWEVEVVGVNYWGIPHDYPYRIWPAAWGPSVPFGEKRLAWLAATREFDAIVLLTDPWHVPKYLAALKKATEGNHPPVLGWLMCDAQNHKGTDLEDLDAVVACTEFGAEEFRRAGYEGPVSVAELAYDPTFFEPLDRSLARQAVMPAVPEDGFLVGFVGRNQQRKRIDLLLAYFAEWIHERKIEDAYLYIQAAPVGTSIGSCDIRSLVQYHGLQGRVLTHEAAGATEQQMAAVYSAMDVYLTTTIGEGWALPVTEAMACGVPCIVPGHSGLASWAGDAALQVPCSETMVVGPLNESPYTIGAVPDRAATVEALHRMYSDSELRATYRERGLARAAELGWQRTGKAVGTALNGLLDRGQVKDAESGEVAA